MGPLLGPPRRWSALCGADDHDKYTPVRHLPTPGQREHSPQRHITAGTVTPTTTDTVNTVPQRANPTQTAYSDGSLVGALWHRRSSDGSLSWMFCSILYSMLQYYIASIRCYSAL